MARGIGGDDGPSLFMFGACVLLFMWMRDTAKKVGGAVGDALEIGQNSAGPLQSETTSEIAAMEKMVAAIAYRSSNLRNPKAFYTNIANKAWSELKAFNTSESALLEMFTPLNADELKCVAKEFGVKENTTVLGMTTVTCTIFKAFDDILTDGMFSKDLTNMHKIWKKTGLW